MTAPTVPDWRDTEAWVVRGLKTIAATGTPHPELRVVPPFIRVQAVPGGPPDTPWQAHPQVELVHYGASRAEAWALARATEDLLGPFAVAGGRLGGIFVDYARIAASAVQIPDTNPDVRPVVVVWRFGVRPQ